MPITEKSPEKQWVDDEIPLHKRAPAKSFTEIPRISKLLVSNSPILMAKDHQTFEECHQWESNWDNCQGWRNVEARRWAEEDFIKAVINILRELNQKQGAVVTEQ